MLLTIEEIEAPDLDKMVFAKFKKSNNYDIDGK